MVLGCGPDVRAGVSVCSGRWRPGRGPGQGDGVLSPTAFLPWDQPCRLRQDSLAHAFAGEGVVVSWVIDRGSGIARATSDDTEQGVLFALTNSQAVIAHLIDGDLITGEMHHRERR